MLENYITKVVSLDGENEEAKREEIREYFHKTYDLDEKLYEVLSSDDSFYLRADPLRHPLIFYFGHTATFFINKLILAKLIDKRINPKFESMFAVGVDEMSWDDLNEAHYDWPTVDEVKKYRDEVRTLVDNLIMTLPLELPINWESPFWVIMMGIEHERIHIETSSVLIRQLPLSAVKKHPLFKICEHSYTAPQNSLVSVETDKVVLGKSFDNHIYGWDNEYGRFEKIVKSFNASKYLVSNQEYLEFVEDEGYQKQEFWTEEGWNWVQYKKCSFPVFWVKKENEFFLRCMAEEIPMPWDWPVEVNYLEAKAFCNWLSKKTGRTLRLPTEEEWHLLYKKNVKEDLYEWEKAPGNINLEYYASSCPVTEFEFGDFFDIIGNVWQWTETPIYGFEGFKVHPYYDDFSTPTFDGRHNLFKGGSWISTGNEATKYARYAFRRHFFQHAGFRYIESDEPVNIQDDSYEDDKDITCFCERDYGKNRFSQINFSVAIAKTCSELCNNAESKTVLDLGCKTGRTTFELARYFKFVTGLDFTARLIRIGTNLKEKGKLRYTFSSEGEIKRFNEVSLSDFELQQTKDKVEFYQADASNLLEKYHSYDLILLENILEETYNPTKLLSMIHSRLNKNGILVVASTYDWKETFTDKENQLGGFRKDGEPVFTKDVVSQILKENFAQIFDEIELPVVTPINDFKGEVKISQITFWQKK